MDVREFGEIIAFGREQQGIEFKQGGSRKDKHLLAKVIRSVMGMANRRDGGRVIVGVSEDSTGRPVLDGLSNEDLSTWNYDALADSLAEYTDPHIQFDLAIVEYESKKFVVIHVAEFDDIPVLCKRDYPNVLRAGGCYVRTRRKPETLEIPTQTDMRDLLDLAIDKGVRKFVARTQAAQLSLSGQLSASDAELFNQQAVDFLGGRE